MLYCIFRKTLNIFFNNNTTSEDVGSASERSAISKYHGLKSYHQI